MNTRNAILAVTIMASLCTAPLAAMAAPQHDDHGGRRNQTVQHYDRRDDRRSPGYERERYGHDRYGRHEHERYGREWYVGRHHYRQVWDFYRCVWVVVPMP